MIENPEKPLNAFLSISQKTNRGDAALEDGKSTFPEIQSSYFPDQTSSI